MIPMIGNKEYKIIKFKKNQNILEKKLIKSKYIVKVFKVEGGRLKR